MNAREFRVAETMLGPIENPDREHLPGIGAFRVAKILTYFLLNEESLLEQAMADVEQHFEASGSWEAAETEPGIYQDLAIFVGLKGDKEEALRYLRLWRLEAAADATNYLSGWGTNCQAMALIGAPKESVECLRQGFEQPSWTWPFLEPHLPWYNPIRETPEFQSLVTDIENGMYH